MSLSEHLAPWLHHSPGCAAHNIYDNGRQRECDCGLDAARAEGDPAAEGDIPSIIERGQTGERLSPTEQSAWTGYELGWKDGLKHAISDLGECFECGHDLNGPYCPACNSDIDATRAEGVAALQQAGEAEGWVLVPREPTADMLAAADSAIPRFEEEIDGSRLMGVDGALDAWKAMIAVSPSPSRQP